MTPSIGIATAEYNNAPGAGQLHAERLYRTTPVERWSATGKKEGIMNPTLKVIAFLICGYFAISSVYAQGPCTMQKVTGTYVIQEKGSSSILDPNAPSYPYHWTGAIAPFIAIGQATFGPDGIGRGFYWIRIGSFTPGSAPIPLEVKITELNADCTGKWQFEVDLLGTPSTIQERFVLFNNGREFRSIATATGTPTMGWIGQGHRMSTPAEPLYTCGPQTAAGTWLMTAENLVRFPTTPIFYDSVLMRFHVLSNGDVTGTLYEKFGPTGNIELPLLGTMTVNADCSYAAALNTTVNGNPVTIPLRGVFFDRGKRSYALNVNARSVGTQYSFGEGVRIGE